MTLSVEEGKLFYRLWLPLLDFVNQKYGVNKKVKKMAVANSLNPEDVKAVSNKLCDDVSVIDEYLQKHDDIPQEHRKIIESWKRCIRGRFIIERHLKSGSIMISTEDENVYQVGGIITSIEKMFYYASMPLMVEATLMPFKDVIITDGLIMPYNLVIGSNMTKSFKDTYLTAKRAGTIRKTLKGNLSEMKSGKLRINRGEKTE